MTLYPSNFGSLTREVGVSAHTIYTRMNPGVKSSALDRVIEKIQSEQVVCIQIEV